MTSSYFFFFFFLSFVLSSLLCLQRLPSAVRTSSSVYVVLAVSIQSYVCACPFTVAALWHIQAQPYIIMREKKKQEASFSSSSFSTNPSFFRTSRQRRRRRRIIYHRKQRPLHMHAHDAPLYDRNNRLSILVRKKRKRRGQRLY